MTAWAARLAPALRAADTLLLSGDLGSGKTHFARGLIRARLGPDGTMAEIPSPSFTLVQTYDTPGAEVWHADLYRLTDPQEVWELGLDAAMDEAICLIEWPDRWADPWPATAAGITLSVPQTAPDTRDATIWAGSEGDLAARIVSALIGS